MVKSIGFYFIAILIGFSVFDYFLKGESGWNMILENIIIAIIATVLFGFYYRWKSNKKNV